MFGHAVTVYFKDVFDKHAATIKELNVNVTTASATCCEDRHAAGCQA